MEQPTLHPGIPGRQVRGLMSKDETIALLEKELEDAQLDAKYYQACSREWQNLAEQYERSMLFGTGRGEA